MSRGNVVPGISRSPSSHFMWIPTFVWKSQFDPRKDVVSDLFLSYVCILSVRDLMNNWISTFAHINRQRPILVTISGKKAKLVLFWLSVSTRTRSHVETRSTVVGTSCCRAAHGSNSTLSLVHWTFELLACTVYCSVLVVCITDVIFNTLLSFAANSEKVMWIKMTRV